MLTQINSQLKSGRRQSRRGFLRLAALGLLAGCTSRLPVATVQSSSPTPVPSTNEPTSPTAACAGLKPMKITDIKTFPVWVGGHNLLIVKVETDAGIYGWGESGLLGRELAVVGAIKHYREFLIGRDPSRIGALWQEMYRSQYFEGGRVLSAAISAIDLALHDIMGRVLGVPVYQLLGGRQRDTVPCFASTWGNNAAELIKNIQSFTAVGWDAVCIAPAGASGNVFDPHESIALTVDWLTKARQAVDAKVVLGVDYHHRLSAAETASFCQKLAPGTLDFLEEPMRDETPEAYQALREMVDVPFAIGEEFSSKWAFLPYLEHDIANFARIDVCNVGGLTEAMKVAGWAEAHYIDLMPHNPLGPICNAALIHLAAAVPNFSWMEVWCSPGGELFFSDNALFPVQPRLAGSHFPVPETPGLGIEVNEDLLARMSSTYRYYEPPHWQEKDGSYTNW
jgi:galactonate dehydratase